MSEAISHEGVVVRAGAYDGRLQRVVVRIEQQAACVGCKAQQMCMASETAIKEVTAESATPLQEGDNVVVSLEKKLGWKAVLLVFGIPTILLLVCVLLAHSLLQNAYWAGIIPLLVLVPYYFVLSRLNGRFEQQYHFIARKTKK